MKFLILIFSALLLSSCGKGVKDSEPNEEEMTQAETAADTAETQEAVEEETAVEPEAPSAAAVLQDEGRPPTDILNCSSGENNLVYELFNYGEPAACLPDAPETSCVCKLHVISNGGAPSIVAHASNTSQWCSRKMDDLKREGKTTFPNGKTLSIPEGYTCDVS